MLKTGIGVKRNCEYKNNCKNYERYKTEYFIKSCIALKCII